MKIKNRLWLLLLALAVSTPTAGIAARVKVGMSVDDVMNMRAVSDPRISPDGRFVAFVVTQADMKTNFRNSDVWIVAAGDGNPRSGGDRPRPLTISPKRDDSPQWSSDGKMLAFISDRDGRAQVYVMPLDGGELERVTDVKTAVQSFAWSPGGKRIAYIAADPVPEAKEQEKKEGFDQIIVDADYQFARISVIDISSSSGGEMPKPTKVTDGALHVTELAWSPDRGTIAFAARSTPKLADGSTTELYVADSVNIQPPLRLTNNDRAESNIAWSPDGRTLSYLSTSDKYPTIGPSRIHLLAFDGIKQQGIKSPQILLPQFDGYITKQEWSADRKFIYFTADTGVERHIYRIATNIWKLETRTRQVDMQGSFSLSQKKNLMVYLREDSTHPADLLITLVQPDTAGDSLGVFDILTQMNPQVNDFILGRVETIKWKSSKDGREIEGVLVYPLDYEQGKRYPLITSLHGGPEGAYQMSFMSSYSEFPHVYAAHGYASFFPNFRGSSNYGAEFASANVGDLGGGDYEDVMSGVDYLIERGIADSARLAIKGYSYGGYLAGWIIGHTDRFKVAVFGAGLSNAISYYSTGDIQYQRETLHQGTPWRNNKNLIERSPVFYLQNAKTPSLIYHGERDERVPLGQSLETYMGLKKAGVTTQLIIYPREGHGLREPKHQLDKMRREMQWIEKYLNGAKNTTAQTQNR
ncbi:MAG: S9 family peptidase [Blastocatellia bacterium]